MSLLRQWAERQEEKLKVAKKIALEAGVLAHCADHNELFFQSLHRRAAAVELAHYKFAHCQLPNIFKNRRELTDSLTDAITNSPLECRSCAGKQSLALGSPTPVN
jgi:hypothetical protein